MADSRRKQAAAKQENTDANGVDTSVKTVKKPMFDDDTLDAVFEQLVDDIAPRLNATKNDQSKAYAGGVVYVGEDGYPCTVTVRVDPWTPEKAKAKMSKGDGKRQRRARRAS